MDYRDSKKFTGFHWGVENCCLGGSAKCSHAIYHSTPNFILITKKDNLTGKKIKSKRVGGHYVRGSRCMASISLHIKRAYLQTHISLHAPFVKSISISPLEYGYEKDDDEEEDQEGVIPVVINSALPEDFPKPCKCLKCARDNTCICRAKGLKCCEYCGCKPDECKNPNL